MTSDTFVLVVVVLESTLKRSLEQLERLLLERQ